MAHFHVQLLEVGATGSRHCRIHTPFPIQNRNPMMRNSWPGGHTSIVCAGIVVQVPGRVHPALPRQHPIPTASYQTGSERHRGDWILQWPGKHCQRKSAMAQTSQMAWEGVTKLSTPWPQGPAALGWASDTYLSLWPPKFVHQCTSSKGYMMFMEPRKVEEAPGWGRLSPGPAQGGQALCHGTPVLA